MKNNYHFAIAGFILYVLLIIQGSCTVLESIALGFSLFSFLNLMHEIGRSFPIREFMAFIAVLQLLLMPTLEILQDSNVLMVQSEEYLAFAVPVTILFSIGVQMPLFKLPEPISFLENVQEYLRDKREVTVLLFSIGLVAWFLSDSLPLQYKAVFRLLTICTHASVLYSIYTPGKLRFYIISATLAAILLQTIREGMFGELVNWTTLWIMIISVGTSWGQSTRIKSLAVIAGLFVIIIIQSIKLEYRLLTWGETQKDRNGDASLLWSLVTNRINNSSTLLETGILNASLRRFNQGYILSHVMAYVPHNEPFGNGEVIMHLSYPFIPRLFWDDKPITGGAANIKRYTSLQISDNTSSNISPVGEAYINFGYSGGLVFIFLFGLLLNYCFHKVLDLARTRPTLILWIPCLFIGSLTMETDILTTWGSFASMAIFLTVLWHTMKRLTILI
jgi:hypothetical protein